MTIEDALLRFEGLDPNRVKNILDDTQRLLLVLEREMPRIERLIENLKVTIAAYEARQRAV